MRATQNLTSLLTVISQLFSSRKVDQAQFTGHPVSHDEPMHKPRYLVLRLMTLHQLKIIFYDKINIMMTYCEVLARLVTENNGLKCSGCGLPNTVHLHKANPTHSNLKQPSD